MNHINAGDISILIVAVVSLLGALTAYLRARTAEAHATSAIQQHVDTTIHTVQQPPSQ